MPPRCSYGKCGDFIQQHRKGVIQLAPGCDADQSLETAVTGVLNNIREAAAKVGEQRCGPFATKAGSCRRERRTTCTRLSDELLPACQQATSTQKQPHHTSASLAASL